MLMDVMSCVCVYVCVRACVYDKNNEIAVWCGAIGCENGVSSALESNSC